MDLKLSPLNPSLMILAHLALRYVNIPYLYGGKNPSVGLDCSGLVCDLLGSTGMIARNQEMGSQQLYDYFKPIAANGEITLGSLAFYGESIEKISHVAMFLDPHFIIEAGHGDHTITTIELALARGARVRVSPFNFRKDLVAVLRPKYEDAGLHD